MRLIRVFVSSPYDVAPERRRIEHVMGRLNAEFGQFAQFEAVRWETRHYRAHTTFQTQIPAAAECDIVIGIFWARLGLELPDDFPRAPDGEPYESGTAYEIRTALERREREAAGPDIFVFRKTAPPEVRIDVDSEIADARHQWERLEAFFSTHFVSKDFKFLRAFNAFATTEAFGADVEKLLRAWVIDNLLADRRAIWNIDLQGSPFRGLAAFEAKHAAIFFGRDRKVARAIELLKEAAENSANGPSPPVGPNVERNRAPFLLIVGTSGSGKSSLMRAGIAPRLTAPGVIPDVDAWRIAVVRPEAGETPLADLAQALGVLGEDDDPGGYGRALPELYSGGLVPTALAQMLAETPEAGSARVIEALDAVARQAPDIGRETAPRAHLLLLVDQMEEVFRSDIREAERTAFLRALSMLAATGRVWIVSTLRDDLYGRLISDRYGIALKDAGATYDLSPPGESELEEILTRSAEAAGIDYEVHPETGEPLNARLVREASGQDVLPLLQFSLNRLFESRVRRDDRTLLTHQAYDAMGGLDGAIDQAAEQALAAMSEAEVARLPRLLRTLAGPLQHRSDASEAAGLTVRPAAYDPASADARDVALAEALIDARIMRVMRGRDGGGLLQIIHERVLSSWARAREAVAAQQDFYRIRDDVEARRRHWERDRKRSDRLLSPGKPLADAESLVVSYRDEMPPETLAFIKASGRRARFRQSLIAVSALVFAGTTVLAGAMGIAADRAGQRAQHNYEAARGFGDGMIETTAETLAEVSGINVSTLDLILGRIQGYFVDLETSNPTADLIHSRGVMLIAFAQTYKRTGNLDQALSRAQDAESIFRTLLADAPEYSDARWRLSQALELIGDVKRGRSSDAEEQAVVRQLRTEARAAFAEALSLREGLTRENSANTEWGVGLAQILTRLGDLDRELGDAASSRLHYERVLQVDARLYLQQPGNLDSARELSWAFNKIGDVRAGADDFAGALAAYQHALCLRRENAAALSDQWRLRLDVSWTLSRIGQTLVRMNRLSAAEPPILEAMIIRRAVYESNPQDARVLRDLLEATQAIAELRLRRNAPLSALDYALDGQRLSEALVDAGREAEGIDRALTQLRALEEQARVQLTTSSAEFDEAGAQARVVAEIARASARLADLEEQLPETLATCRSALDAELNRMDV